MTDLLECGHVNVSYGKRKILEDVNFSLHTQEIVTMIGTSGGGKSTILSALAGFIPYTGHILLNKKEIKGSDQNRGVVFQDASLYPWLTVEQNITFGLKATGKNKIYIRNRSRELLKLINLENYRRQPISALSGGMQQRVAIARALANKPNFLLMDEPFSALDTVTKDRMENFIRKISYQQKVGILLITHDLDEAIRCGQKILVLDKKKKNFREFKNAFYAIDQPTAQQLAHLNNFKNNLIAYLK